MRGPTERGYASLSMRGQRGGFQVLLWTVVALNLHFSFSFGEHWSRLKLTRATDGLLKMLAEMKRLFLKLGRW